MSNKKEIASKMPHMCSHCKDNPISDREPWNESHKTLCQDCRVRTAKYDSIIKIRKSLINMNKESKDRRKARNK